ncbi:SDR family oxidoreductase [Microbacterium sp.]|uniref:SDR family oxidoreductase n=1 Tax=Microbacterium sp. TaxID=51671 RepID=UPI0025CD669F|nr:SDR family oxidoreductase [Microbacterium sp.]
MYRELLELYGKVAVVTGGGRGIGGAIVDALSEAGATVIAADVLDVEQDDAHSRVTHRQLDVTDAAAVEAFFSQIVVDFGRLDILVTSAGIASHTPALELPAREWSRVFDVNTTGTFWCAREAIRNMAGSGSVVAVGSMSGDIANAPQRQVAYNASKGAVHLVVKSLAVEFAEQGIRVNAVAPGYVMTDLTREGVPQDWIADWERRTPMGRLGTPREIASLVAFIASDAASYMTGSIVTIDGGYTAW